MKILPIYVKQYTNFYGNIPIKPNRVESFADKLELSNKNNLSKTDIVPKKYLNLFKERFFKDYTPEEILDLKNRYTEIVKISDTEQFLYRVCEELKKDYNIEKIPIKLNPQYRAQHYTEGVTATARNTPRYNQGFIEIDIDTKSKDNYSLFCIMAHELRHVVQTMICYQHSTNQEYANALLESCKDSGKYYWLSDAEIMETYITPFVNSMVEFFENLGIKKLEKTDSSYNFGRKILKSLKKFANKNATAYIDAYHERDAKETEKLMSDIVFY